MGLKIYATTPETSTKVDLTDNVNLSTLDLDQLGQPPVNNITESGPQQHGATYVGYRLRPRVFVLGLEATGSTFQELMNQRQKLTEIFSPRDKPITVSLEWDVAGAGRGGPISTMARAIDCYFEDGLNFAWADLEGYNQKARVVLYAPNPAWYDPNPKSFSFGAGAGGTPMPIPWVFPLKVGNSTLNQSAGIDYLGTWDEYPIVIFQGPIVDPVIYNHTTGEKLDFTGTSINAGATIKVDCRYGYKTVLDNVGNWVVDKLTNDSNLATFHFSKRSYPNPVSSQAMQVTGTGITTATRVIVNYFDRYLGL